MAGEAGPPTCLEQPACGLQPARVFGLLQGVKDRGQPGAGELGGSIQVSGQIPTGTVDGKLRTVGLGPSRSIWWW